MSHKFRKADAVCDSMFDYPCNLIHWTNSKEIIGNSKAESIAFSTESLTFVDNIKSLPFE